MSKQKEEAHAAWCRAAEAWVLEELDAESPGGLSMSELRAGWSYDPAELDAALRRLQLAGSIACTAGIWWFRRPVLGPALDRSPAVLPQTGTRPGK